MSFIADTDALKWACCKVVTPRHCAEMKLQCQENNLLFGAVECEVNCGFHFFIGAVGVTEF